MTSAPDIAGLPISVATPALAALRPSAVAFRIAELVLLFLGIPSLIWLHIIPVWMFWIILGAAAFYVCTVLTLDRTFRWRSVWNWPAAKREMRRIALLWAMGCVIIAAFTLSVDRHILPLDVRQPRELFFTLPARNPGLWCAIMVLYPIFSALPQELIYRVFFFHRYERMLGVWGGGWGGRAPTVIASALAFGWGHIMFQNWIAVSLSALLGLLIAITYARTRSGAAAWIEHALYGNAAFTIGLGWFFFTGSVHT